MSVQSRLRVFKRKNKTSQRQQGNSADAELARHENLQISLIIVRETYEVCIYHLFHFDYASEEAHMQF